MIIKINYSKIELFIFSSMSLTTLLIVWYFNIVIYLQLFLTLIIIIYSIWQLKRILTTNIKLIINDEIFIKDNKLYNLNIVNNSLLTIVYYSYHPHIKTKFRLNIFYDSCNDYDIYQINRELKKITHNKSNKV